MMRYIISTIGTLCLCLMGGLAPARAQIELPQQQGLTDVGHQKIQTLIITNDGTAISSLTPSAWTDDDRQKLVMWLSGNGFADIDADGTDGVYTDYIWIHPGSLSNGSITPDDIEGRLGVLDVLQDGMCTGNTTEGSLTGVRGFDSEGKPLCIQSTNPYWRGGGSVIYRDDANYSLPAIHIGCEDTDCPGDSDTMIAVDGATRIPGDGATVGFGEGNDRFIVNQNNIQLNTAGASTPIIIAKGGRVGVRQPDPRQALDVVGGLVAQDQRTISPSYGGSSAKGNSLVLSVDGDRTILSHPNTILLSKGQHSRLTQSGGSASANRAYASMRGGGSVAVRIYCPPVSSQCEIGVFGLQPTTLRIAHGSRTLITQGSAIEHRATVARSSLLPSQIDVTATGVKRSITINRAGLPSSSDFSQVYGGGDVYHFASYERDAIRVAMGFDLSQGNFVGPIEKAANLTVQGPTTIKGGAESDLRMRNLRPSNPVYHTLEEVGCKLLTIDDDGHMQLVSYMPERCNGSVMTYHRDGCSTIQPSRPECREINDQDCSKIVPDCWKPYNSGFHGGQLYYDLKNPQCAYCAQITPSLNQLVCSRSGSGILPGTQEWFLNCSLQASFDCSNFSNDKLTCESGHGNCIWSSGRILESDLSHSRPICKDNNGQIVDASFCDVSTAPQCDGAIVYSWKAGEWSQCGPSLPEITEYACASKSSNDYANTELQGITSPFSMSEIYGELVDSQNSIYCAEITSLAECGKYQRCERTMAYAKQQRKIWCEDSKGMTVDSSLCRKKPQEIRTCRSYTQIATPPNDDNGQSPVYGTFYRPGESYMLLERPINHYQDSPTGDGGYIGIYGNCIIPDSFGAIVYNRIPSTSQIKAANRTELLFFCAHGPVNNQFGLGEREIYIVNGRAYSDKNHNKYLEDGVYLFDPNQASWDKELPPYYAIHVVDSEIVDALVAE